MRMPGSRKTYKLISSTSVYMIYNRAALITDFINHYDVRYLQGRLAAMYFSSNTPCICLKKNNDSNTDRTEESSFFFCSFSSVSCTDSSYWWFHRFCRFSATSRSYIFTFFFLLFLLMARSLFLFIHIVATHHHKVSKSHARR